MSLGVVALLCGCGGDDTTDDSHPATTRVGDTGESTTSNDEGSSSPMTTETGATAPDTVRVLVRFLQQVSCWTCWEYTRMFA